MMEAKVLMRFQWILPTLSNVEFSVDPYNLFYGWWFYNLVPRVSHLTLSSKMRDPGNEVAIDNYSLKQPSHGKLKLANSCWQTQVGVCERRKNNRQTRSICRQQFANVFADGNLEPSSLHSSSSSSWTSSWTSS